MSSRASSRNSPIAGRLRPSRPCGRVPEKLGHSRLLALHLIRDDLRTHRPITAAAAHAIPSSRMARWLPLQLPSWGLGIENALECECPPIADNADCTSVRVHDFRTVGGAGERLGRGWLGNRIAAPKAINRRRLTWRIPSQAGDRLRPFSEYPVGTRAGRSVE